MPWYSANRMSVAGISRCGNATTEAGVDWRPSADRHEHYELRISHLEFLLRAKLVNMFSKFSVILATLSVPNDRNSKLRGR